MIVSLTTFGIPLRSNMQLFNLGDDFDTSKLHLLNTASMAKSTQNIAVVFYQCIYGGPPDKLIVFERETSGSE